MSRFWNPIVHQLQPYVPGEQPKVDNLTKLNTNENPYGPSAKVVAAISDANDDGLRLYPDPYADLLKQKLADYYQLSRNQVFVGNGSDEVLAHTFKALFQPDADILFPDISYSFYPVYCALFELSYRTPALNSDFDIVSSDYQGNNGGIIFPNPNAPTGKYLALEAIQDILHDNPNSVVVVDEAYIDFGGQSAVSLIANNPNLLVIQTLSKSRSLAGLRVGFALGNAELIAGLERVKNSFNSYPLDRFSIAGAVAALDDEDYFKQTCNSIIASRERLSTALTGLGFDVVPSAANFIFVKHPQHNAEQLAQQLRQKNIIVRYFNKPRIDQYLRITIGTDAECDLLINALNTLVHKNSI